MTIKQVYTIKDEVLDRQCEVFGHNGVLQQEDEGLMLLDFCQIAQHIIENSVRETGENSYIISNRKLIKECNDYAEIIYNIVIDTVYYNAISDINDDEELELIINE